MAMKASKMLESFSKALSLVFLLKLIACHEAAAFSKAETVKIFNDTNFYNGLSIQHAGGDVVHDNRAARHSRSKRFIAFPVGSSFSTAVCMTTGVIGNPVTEYLSMGLNWGLAYDLPNSTWVLQHANGFGSHENKESISPQIKRRHRRDLYGNLETLINGSSLKQQRQSNQKLQALNVKKRKLVLRQELGSLSGEAPSGTGSCSPIKVSPFTSLDHFGL